jgi:hypothetical protein
LGKDKAMGEKRMGQIWSDGKMTLQKKGWPSDSGSHLTKA